MPDRINTLSELLKTTEKRESNNLVVAGGEELEVLEAVSNACSQNLVKAILIGNENKIKAIANEHNIDISNCKIIHEPELKNTGKIAVKMIRDGKAQMLMKGLIDSALFLKAILHEESGVVGKGLLSHVAIFEIPTFPKLFFVTDPAINIAPDLNQKVDICNNAIQVANAIGIEKPKIAAVTAVEKVNYPKMPATIDAAALSKMSERGQIKAIVDGPLALDNALSAESAKTKGIDSPVAGDVDILLMPDIEAGNILYKALQQLAKAKIGAIVMGAKCPVVLTSRADSAETKLLSIALSAIVSDNTN
jgi:phosphate butyryltransferase